MVRDASLEPSNTLNRWRHVERGILEGEFLNGATNGRWNFLKDRVTDELGEALEASLRKILSKILEKKDEKRRTVVFKTSCNAGLIMPGALRALIAMKFLSASFASSA